MQQSRARLDEQERLLLGVAEQLMQPLVQLKRLSELADGDTPERARERWQVAQVVSEAGLRLAESYALSLRVQGKMTALQIEPVTVSSLLYDTAQDLQDFARQYDVELELDTGPRLQPVLADRSVLQSALTSLGQVFVLAQAETNEDAPVRLSAHKSRYGVVAGLYGGTVGLGAESLRRAHALQGTARQPLRQLVSGPAAGVFVADSLLHTLSARLHVARYHKLAGLAATLTPSHQLQLV